MHHLGLTRSTRQPDHLLHTPDAFVRTPLPGLTGGLAIIHTAPAFGAAFTQYTVELEPQGTLANARLPFIQRFVYVVSGLATLTPAFLLTSGSFAYLPPNHAQTLTATAPTTLQVIDKTYTALPGTEVPTLLIGTESEVSPVPLSGDPDLQVRALLPAHSSFDFAVNTMTYAPGAALAQVEVHIMEHGLLMLEGSGIYRLNDRWYPVTAGDFIWMAPFCPQWFAAVGKTPAKYLIYKDCNRHPLS